VGKGGSEHFTVVKSFSENLSKKSPCLPAVLDFFWQGCLLFEVLHSETGLAFGQVAVTSGEARPPLCGVKVGGTCAVLWFTCAQSKIGVPHRLRNGEEATPSRDWRQASRALCGSAAGPGSLTRAVLIGLPIPFPGTDPGPLPLARVSGLRHNVYSKALVINMIDARMSIP